MLIYYFQEYAEILATVEDSQNVVLKIINQFVLVLKVLKVTLKLSAAKLVVELTTTALEIRVVSTDSVFQLALSVDRLVEKKLFAGAIITVLSANVH